MLSKLTPRSVGNILFGVFLIYYFAAKYFVGGFTGFSWPYLISVIVLVTLTAALPYYVSRYLVNKSGGQASWIVALLVPTLLTAAGLSLYFILYIQPNYETIKLPAILHRAIMPGVVISVLMLINRGMAKLAASNHQQG